MSSGKSQILNFDGFLLSKSQKMSTKKVQKSYLKMQNRNLKMENPNFLIY